MPKGEVKFEHVMFAYPTRADSLILKDLQLSVPSGSVTAVVGASGSGKSTLASLLLRLYDPLKGDIFFDGIPVSQYDTTWLHNHIGIVSQVSTKYCNLYLWN